MKKEDRQKVIIGIVGPFGSGKTSAADYLTQKGFHKITLSSFVVEEIKKQNQSSKVSRVLLQNTANQLRKKFGADVLAKKAINLTDKLNKLKIIIDGIRNVAEIKFLKKIGKSHILGISAETKMRFDRLQKNPNKKLKSLKEFVRLQAKENGLGQKNTGLQTRKCWNLKDYKIQNNGSINDLKRKIDVFLQVICHKSLKIIILGPPGAGKSTQGKLLAKATNLPWISIGELMRNEYKKGTSIGKECWSKYMSKGLNVPIGLKFKILENKLSQCHEGFILDDFPRSKDDVDALKDYLKRTKIKLDKVILINVPESTSVSRILKRWQTGLKKGIERYDDSEYILKIRIKEGYKKDLPVIMDYFKQQNLLKIVEGNNNKTIEDVSQEIIKKIFTK